MDYETTCCFSGHRVSKLPWIRDRESEKYNELKTEIETKLDVIYAAGYRSFICGMATGCDLVFAEAVLRLKRSHPDVQLIAAIPHYGHDEQWEDDQKLLYRHLITLCDDINILQQLYTSGCMQDRNRYMVDNSSMLYACYFGFSGGTLKTIDYARQLGKKIVISEFKPD